MIIETSTENEHPCDMKYDHAATLIAAFDLRGGMPGGSHVTGRKQEERYLLEGLATLLSTFRQGRKPQAEQSVKEKPQQHQRAEVEKQMSKNQIRRQRRQAAKEGQ